VLVHDSKRVQRTTLHISERYENPSRLSGIKGLLVGAVNLLPVGLAGCGNHAGWGFAKPRQTPHWFCFEHRSNGEAYL
jgi:hypothetical protein